VKANINLYIPIVLHVAGVGGIAASHFNIDILELAREHGMWIVGPSFVSTEV